MNKAFLISVSTALALGYTAGFTTNNITASAAIDSSQDFYYSVEYAPTPLKNCIKNSLITDNICPLMNAELELSGGKSCDQKDFVSAEIRSVKTDTGNREYIVRAQMRRKGTYSPSNPD